MTRVRRAAPMPRFPTTLLDDQRLSAAPRARGAVALFAVLAAVSAAGGSLGTRFALVEMPGVVPGKSCAACLPDGSYYSLRNDSDVPLRVRLSCERPGFVERSPGARYEAIPDRGWVSFDPAVVELPPRSEGESIVRVTVPDAPENYGRHWEFHVRASAVAGQAGVMLTSRVRFDTVEAGAEDARKAAPPRPPEVKSLDPPPRRPLWRRILFFWE